MELAVSIFCSGIFEIVTRLPLLGIFEKREIVSSRLIPFIDRYSDQVLKILAISDRVDCIYTLNELLECIDNWGSENEIWEESILLGLIEIGCSRFISCWHAEEASVIVSYSTVRVKFKRYDDGFVKGTLFNNGNFVCEVSKSGKHIPIGDLIGLIVNELISNGGIYDLTLRRQMVYDMCVKEVMEKWEDNGKKTGVNSARVRQSPDF